MLPLLDAVLEELFYNSKNFGDYALGFLAGACELARLILVVLLIGAVGRAGRAGGAAGQSKAALLMVCITAGTCVLVHITMSLIFREGKPSPKSELNLGLAVMLLLYLAHAAMAFVPAVVAQFARSNVRTR